jgi:hypothetical protein
MFSETVTDLANEILLCEDWDPNHLHDPDQPTTPEPTMQHVDQPLSPALPTAVKIPLSSTARVDGFIDDLICVFLDSPKNRAQAPHAIPLAMFVTSRSHTGDDAEPIERRNILSLLKLQAKGSPDERQNVLG